MKKEERLLNALLLVNNQIRLLYENVNELTNNILKDKPPKEEPPYDEKEQ